MSAPKMTLFFLLFCCVSASASAQQIETARDAYLEAWFQETAEGNLEAALRCYRQCVALGAEKDRELAAKAAWRIARIARARGDEAAARAQLEQVIERYAGTSAAAEAKADLERPDGDGAGDRESAAVAEARAMVDELLESTATANSRKVAHIFRTLSVGEVFEIHGRVGGNIENLFHFLDEREFPHVLEEVMLRSPPAYSDNVLRKLVNVPEYRMSPAVRDFLEANAGRIGDWVAAFLCTRTGPEGLELLERLLTTQDECTLWLQNYQYWEMLLADELPEAVPVVDTGLRIVFEKGLENGLERWVPVKSLLVPTPATRRFVEQLPQFPLGFRYQLARFAVREVKGDQRRAWIDRVLQDPEPLIRREAIVALMFSDAPDWRREGIERFLASGPPFETDLIRSLVRDKSTTVPLDELMAFSAGDLRECVYYYVLGDRRRNPAETIRFGLDRRDEELPRALLAPRFGENPDLTDGGGRFYAFSGWSFRPESLQASLHASPEQDTVRRLAEEVAASADERLRLGLVELTAACGNDRAFSGVADLLARDPSARVRLKLVASLGLVGLSLDSRVALLLDPSERVASAALLHCEDADALAAAAGRVPIERLPEYGGVVLSRQIGPAVRTVYERLPSDSGIVPICFEFLWGDDVRLLVGALRRGDPITLMALEKLNNLDLPEDLAEQVWGVYGPRWSAGPQVAALADLLESRIDEVAAALRARSIREILDNLTQGNRQSPAAWRADGERLADLGARDELVELARSGSAPRVERGGHGLVKLGMRDELLTALDSSSAPGMLAPFGLALGLEEELIELAGEGRLENESLVSAGVEAGRGDFLARLLCPPVDRPERIPWGGSWNLGGAFDLALAHLVETRDAGRIAFLAEAYDNVSAVRALFQLEAYDHVFGGMQRWSQKPVDTAFAELRARTGLPEDPDAKWPRFVTEQDALIAAWRQALMR